MHHSVDLFSDPASSLVFEMTVISLTQIMVVFEHPAYDTMITGRAVACALEQVGMGWDGLVLLEVERVAKLGY